MRKHVIAGNWKMNLSSSEAIEFVKGLIDLKNIDFAKKDVIIAAPFVYLFELENLIKNSNSNIKIFAQNFFYEDAGAYTGEISISMLKSIGVAGSIVGHSERRSIFKEDDELINKKIKSAVSQGVEVIFCVGETLQERLSDIHNEIVVSQLGLGLNEVSIDEMKYITIAYEPVWAIGTGKTASSDDAQSMHRTIRNFLERKYNKSLAEDVRILYGGSVKPENISDLMKMEDIDGVLVGGASLKLSSFEKIINY